MLAAELSRTVSDSLAESALIHLAAAIVAFDYLLLHRNVDNLPELREQIHCEGFPGSRQGIHLLPPSAAVAYCNQLLLLELSEQGIYLSRAHVLSYHLFQPAY